MENDLEFFEVDDPDGLHSDCPNCFRAYDEADQDYQICSKCGWDANENAMSVTSRRAHRLNDYLSGEADILTGEWY